MSRTLGRLPFNSRRELSICLGCDWVQLKELANHAGKHYKPFDLEGGGKLRHIDAPQEPLKGVQSKIARFLKSEISFPASILGGVKNGSPRANAELHLARKLVFKTDIRDCFPSISNRHVFKVFRERLLFSDEISDVLTKLTTFQRRLPQGSPASSILANLVLLPLHDEIIGICEPLGVVCTFFVDDITLSGAQVRKAAGLVVECIKRYGFSMRARKVRLLAQHRKAQLVTGIVVNRSRLSIGRKRKNELRARIHHLSKIARPGESDLRSLRSSIAQVKYVSRPQGEALEKLANRKLPGQGLPDKPMNTVKRHVCKSTHKHCYWKKGRKT